MKLDQTISVLSDVTCPLCDEQLTMASEVRIIEQAEADEKGRIVFKFALLNIELVGGECGHAEELRDLVVFERDTE